MRIVVRDAEWVVRKSDPTVDGGYLIECEGISELVRGKEGRFIIPRFGKADSSRLHHRLQAIYYSASKTVQAW